ncbi:apoptosis-associated speck-like protein containing a CARD [Toxotes jaculatrix]|uniref:apoptosis-associated speck-like protein containing a CARD n=1 Tax=Toxotes jaculatrix TaxID=941984 RepID=UPI001B3AB719|nr:apoptosis-associated speck-like protein containing a CARD [Toxotes jaculatrix]
MAPKTKKTALRDALEDLSKQNFDKFCAELLDRREEPRVRRNKVEGKGFIEITDVLVSTFTEAKAVEVAVDILRQIGCNEDAERLVEEVEEINRGCRESATPSSGAAGGNKRAQSGCTDRHFVDIHKLELTRRVSSVAPILDELLDSNVIQQEGYDRIRALATSQDKIREIYIFLRAGETCKDIFYEVLKKNEPFLIADLHKKK